MRSLNTGFAVLFMLILLIPLVFVDLSADRKSKQENRMLAAPPALEEIKNHPASFVRGFEAWFKDSIGFREKLLGLHKAIDQKGRGIVYTDGQYKYVIGRQGHRFFAGADGIMISSFQGKRNFSDEQIMNMAQRLEEVRNYLAEKQIPFIVMFCTDKEAVYPEYYPASIRRGPEPIELDRITNYVKKHTDVDIFNIRRALVAEKANYPVYVTSSGDLTHYNETGAFFSYRELMSHINAYFPEITPFALNDVDIKYDGNGNPLVSLQEKSYKEFDTAFFDDVDIQRPFTWENQAFENTDSEQPTILIMCDSYSEEKFIGKYLAQHFGKAIFIHYQNMQYLDSYINKYQPDIVVFESAERQLVWFNAVVMNMPKLP